MTEKTYEDGVREGRIKGIEETVNHHDARLNSVEKRLTGQERISYALLGAIGLMQVLPAIQGLLN